MRICRAILIARKCSKIIKFGNGNCIHSPRALDNLRGISLRLISLVKIARIGRRIITAENPEASPTVINAGRRSWWSAPRRTPIWIFTEMNAFSARAYNVILGVRCICYLSYINHRRPGAARSALPPLGDSKYKWTIFEGAADVSYPRNWYRLSRANSAREGNGRHIKSNIRAEVAPTLTFSSGRRTAINTENKQFAIEILTMAEANSSLLIFTDRVISYAHVSFVNCRSRRTCFINGPSRMNLHVN